MKIVVVSDLHGDRSTLGMSRTPEVKKALNEAVEYAVEIEASAFLCLGDISNPDSGGAMFKAIDMCIEAAFVLADHEIRSVWIAGNHDVWEDGSGMTCLSPLAAIERSRGAGEWIYVAERPRVVDLSEEFALLCLPFTPVSHNYNPRAVAIDTFVEHGHRKIITAGHLMIAGVVPGEETTEMPRGRDVAFPIEETSKSTMRLNGHYHHRQTTAEGIIIPGSLCRFTFADENHEPGYLSIEL